LFSEVVVFPSIPVFPVESVFFYDRLLQHCLHCSWDASWWRVSEGFHPIHVVVCSVLTLSWILAKTGVLVADVPETLGQRPRGPSDWPIDSITSHTKE
jgi:hypothetical protein